MLMNQNHTENKKIKNKRKKKNEKKKTNKLILDLTKGKINYKLNINSKNEINKM